MTSFTIPRKKIFGALLCVFLAIQCLEAAKPDSTAAKDKEKTEQRKSAKLPPCAACSALVTSFEAGIKRTSRGKLEGGDTSWEEKNQAGGYANSEVRFVEIQEKLCADVGKGEDQCHAHHHEWEEQLESWWKSDEDVRPALKDYLCVQQLQVCCSENHYGPECKECSQRDASGKLCSGNGKCKGSGTRKGNGKCACDKGYKGELCDQCGVGYFESYKDSEKLLCSECHKACEGHCTGAGPKSCASCKPGYSMETEHGCLDLDECHPDGGGKDPCQTNQFCVNTEGSYKCFDCDKSCHSCFADGPDSCNECAEGYVMNPNKDKEGAAMAGSEGVCVTQETAGRMFSISNTRYFTYGGLCVATCIIFQRSAYIAGFLGLVIAMYITLSEYYLQDASGELRPITV